MVLTAPFVPQFALSYLAFDCYIAGPTGHKNVAASLLTAGKHSFCTKLIISTPDPAAVSPLQKPNWRCKDLSHKRAMPFQGEHVCLVSPFHRFLILEVSGLTLSTFSMFSDFAWNVKQSVRGADRVREENMAPTSSLLH